MVKVGDKIVLLCDIWDDGADHHPPGWLALKGETLIVKDVGEYSLGVAHEGRSGAFSVYEGEWEATDA